MMSDVEPKKSGLSSTDGGDTNEIVKDVEYDDLLSSAGDFGRYQIFILIFTCPFYIFGAFSYFTQLFLTEVSPNHWCWIPELENLTDIERRELAIPKDVNARFGYSHCNAYVANWTHVLITGQTSNETWPQQSCQHGWEFNKSEIPYPTISSEFEWVCEKNSYQATAQSIFFIGSMVAGFLIGWIADRFGRLLAATISNLIGCIAGALSIFATDLLQFSLCRFFMGMSYDNCMMKVFLLVLEYLSPKYRSVTTNIQFAIFFCIGATALPWIALACGNWKTLSLATSLPMALSLLALFVVPESPRWLLSRGRIDEAISHITKIAKINNKEVSNKLINQFKVTESKKGKLSSASVLDIFKNPLLRKAFIFMSLQLMSCSIIFDVLVRSINGFGFDFFLSFTFLSATEFPSVVLMSVLVDFAGRKWLSIVVLSVCCVFSIITTFIGPGLQSTLCAVVARFAVNMAFNITMQWSAEILPTPVRGSGVSIIHICGYVAIVISPYIVYLNNFISWLPLVAVGGIAAFGTILSFMLPETAGIELPQTFEDAENLIKNQKLFYFPCLQKKLSDSNGQNNPAFEMN